MLLANKIYLGDNLELLKQVDSGVAQLVYADPPFSTGQDFHLSDGSIAYSDKYNVCELVEMLIPRVKECHRVLTLSGACFIHTDARFTHHLRMECDKIFGEANFRNEIIWCYRTSLRNSTNAFAWNHDNILFYAKSPATKIHPNPKYFPASETTVKRWAYLADENGHVESEKVKSKFFNKDRVFSVQRGILKDWWEISPVSRGWNKEMKFGKYPTQKPELLLEMIIDATTNVGDLVIDPFIGSGTTCVVAKRMNRKFLGIDRSDVAIQMATKRLASISTYKSLF